MAADRNEPWNTPLGGGREDEEEPAKELSRSCQGGGRQLREHGHLGAKGSKRQTCAEEMRTERKLLDSWQVSEEPDKSTFMGRGTSSNTVGRKERGEELEKACEDNLLKTGM